MWKFDLAGTFLGGFNIAYEIKIIPKWSCNIQSITDLTNLYKISTLGLIYNLNPSVILKQDLNFQLRYYYNAGRRIRSGKKSGFYGNYCGLSFNNQFLFFNPRNSENLNNSIWIVQPHNLSWNFIYGIQRKLGRIGYIDGSLGFGFKMQSGFGTGLNVYGEWKSPLEFSILPKLSVGIAF